MESERAPFVAFRPDDDPLEQLLDACRRRLVLDCALDDGHGPFPAEAVRAVCLSDGLDPIGVRLANAWLRDELNLRFATVDFPLQLLGCRLDEPLHLGGAQIKQLAVTSGEHLPADLAPHIGESHVHGLMGSGLVIDRDLVLSGSTISGSISRTVTRPIAAAVWLNEAYVGGRLIAQGTTIESHVDRAISADGLTVVGHIDLAGGFRANAEVRFLGARVGGTLDLSGVHLEPERGSALNLTRSEFAGGCFIGSEGRAGHRAVIAGRIDLHRAVFGGRFYVGDATLSDPFGERSRRPPRDGTRTGAVAIDAPGLVVQGRLEIGGSTTIDGEVVLSRADLRGGLFFADTTLSAPGRIALDLSQAKTGSAVELVNCDIEGSVDVSYARMTGPLRLPDTRLHKPADAPCLDGTGARIEGNLVLRNLRATGGSVYFRNARIAGDVNAEGAVIENPGDRTLSLSRAQVDGDIGLWREFTSRGVVVLNRTTVEGRLMANGARLTWDEGDRQSFEANPRLQELNPQREAFLAVGATVRSGITLGWTVEGGGVNFMDASTTYIADDPERDWPASSRLGGFSYERFAPRYRLPAEWRPGARANWLARFADYDPRPWGQAARVLAANGDERGAETLLMAQRRHERHRRIGAQKHFWRRGLDVLQDRVIGYGHRPQRVLVVILALIASVTLTLSVPAWRASMRSIDEAGVVYSPAGPVVSKTGPRCGNGAVRCLEPALYAVDTVVPIIDLGQRSTWYPSTDAGGTWLEWWLNLCTILGWTASTVFALALARLGRTTP